MVSVLFIVVVMMFGFDKWCDYGLFVICFGMGVMFVMYGWFKMVGGVKVWIKFGYVMCYFGIDFVFMMWGFVVVILELVGGVLLVLGLLFCFVCMMLVVIMVVVVIMYLGKGDGIMGVSYVIEVGIVFFGLLFIGLGCFVLDGKFGCG